MTMTTELVRELGLTFVALIPHQTNPLQRLGFAHTAQILTALCEITDAAEELINGPARTPEGCDVQVRKLAACLATFKAMRVVEELPPQGLQS